MYFRIGKPIFDFVLSLLLILFTLPLILLIGILIGLIDRQWPIFIQKRTGYKMQPFVIYKFRTMRDHDMNLTNQLEHTSILGRLLRIFSLDELPQLMNVLKGEMSLIGPRPLIDMYDAHYTLEQKKRFEVKPGISGMAQIKGRNKLTWEEKFKWDIYYVENISLWLDIKITILTIVKIFHFDDVNFSKNQSVQTFFNHIKK
jgi:undecaprenyl phosphate N,N'-diacetylbacillosamine 1-phosphate transferase